MFSLQLLQKQALPLVPRQRAPSLAQGGSHSEWSGVIGSRRMADRLPNRDQPSVYERKSAPTRRLARNAEVLRLPYTPEALIERIGDLH
jgi:hypothetical protein